jgi:hypothetical protein
VWQLSVSLMNWVWLDILQLDLEGFISYAEINQILLKIYFIPILLTFTFLVAL